MNPPLTRRDFLRAGGATLALAAVRPVALVAEEKVTVAPPRRQLKKGIMWGTVDVKGSVVEKMRAIKAAGFEGVEMSSHMDVEEVLRARDEAGLEIPSVCGVHHWARPLSDPDPKVRADGLAALEQSLRDAKRYGASSVLLVPAVVNQQVSYADAYTRSQMEIRKAVPLAEELGVKIAIENVWNHFLLSPLEAARYVDEFNSPAVGWHFDVGNIINYGWPEQWIRTLGPRIQKLHIKEFSRTKRDQEGLWKGFAVEFLTGDNNWPAVMKALDDINYRGWAIVEPAWKPPGVDPAERLRQIVDKLDRILAS
jgi:hexulose-6-phosphate isomerase